MCAPVIPFVLLLAGLVIILPIVLICVLLGKRRGQPTAQVQPRETTDPAERNRKREEILKQLAAKEITKEEAEQQLLELENPVPEQLPAAPPPPRNGCGSGCLVAVICAIVAVLLLLLFLLPLAGIGFHRASNTAQRITYQHEVR
jgi:cytochrome c-type biogenesis protein CcmH/NrfG